MPNQEQSKDGIPRKDSDRPSPDVERAAVDGQSNASGRGASDEQGRQGPGGSDSRKGESPLPRHGEEKGTARSDDPSRQDYRGDGPGKVGITSDSQPDLVAPSGVNERDHGAAEDKPMAGGSVNLDDDDMVHPRGKVTSTGGTWKAEGGDSAPLGPPGAGLSNKNGPSDRSRE